MRLNLLVLLSFLGLLQIHSYALNIKVFTIQPINYGYQTKHHIEVYDLSEMKRLNDQISQNTNQIMSEKGEAGLKHYIEHFTQSHQVQYQKGILAMNLVLELNVQGLPAIVIEDEAIIEGTTDINQAVSAYYQYKRESR